MIGTTGNWVQCLVSPSLLEFSAEYKWPICGDLVRMAVSNLVIWNNQNADCGREDRIGRCIQLVAGSGASDLICRIGSWGICTWVTG